MNLLEIRNLRVHIGSFSPVRGVSLAVKQGEFVGLIGSSGSGKSTIAQAILRLVPEMSLQGQVLFKRQDLLSLSEADMCAVRGAKIGIIFQEPMTSLNPLHPVGNQIFEALSCHSNHPTKERVYELMRLVDLRDISRIYHAYPHELSGGQRQRIMIAMALVSNPDLLIADEPTTALDVCVQAQILSLLKTIQQKLGLAVLFITHDLELVKQQASRIYVMKYGKIVSTQLPDPVHLPVRLKASSKQPPVVLDVRRLSVMYHDFKAVQEVSFILKAGQTLSVVGESGSGKSSLAFGLLRLIAAQGQVFLNKTDFFALSGRALTQARAGIQLVFQDPMSSLNPRLSIADLIEEGLTVHHRDKDKAGTVADILTAVGLSADILKRYPHELSGGQRVRVALARVLVLHPQVVILDEVTSSLDVQTQRQIIQLLNDLQHTYQLSYIFISHDMRLVKAVSDDVLVLKSGRVIEYGAVDAIFKKPKHPWTRELIKASFLP